MKRIIVIAITAAFALAAQPRLIPPFETTLRGYFEAVASDRDDMLDQLVSPEKAYTAYLLRKQQQMLTGRNDKELGATAQAQSGTGLVSLAGVPNLISAAIESGALTQTGSGTATTVKLKPLAVYDLFTGQDQTPCSMFKVLTSTKAVASDGKPVGKQCGTALDQAFGGLSASITLNNAEPNQTQAQPVAAANSTGKTTAISAQNGTVLSLLTQQRTVTAWGAKWEMYNPRNPRHRGFSKAWNTAMTKASLKTAGDSLGTATNKLIEAATLIPTFKAWQADTANALAAARSLGWPELEQAWQSRLDAFPSSIADLTAAKDFDAARRSFLDEENKVLKAELEKPILSLEYTNQRQLNQPDLSNLKFIVSKAYQVQNSQKAVFSFNAAADIYNTIPTGAKAGRLRDVSAALQWDIPVGQIRAGIPTTFTIAAYYQYQIQSGLIMIGAGNLVSNTSIELPSDAKTLLAPKGGIFIAQAKLTFKMKDGSTKVPIGVSYANRTELIKAPEVRGHIGLQFDWSTLFGPQTDR